MSLEHSPMREAGAAALTNDGLLDDWLTDAELARELNRDKRTIQRWRRLGEAPPSMILGRERRTRREAAAAWLREREQAFEAA